MATWTLSDIRSKVRQVTGRLSTSDLTDTKINEYINQYYQYTFPAEVKLDKKHIYYELLTTANNAWYDAPDGSFTNYEPPATIDNLELSWYQDPGVFINENPMNITRVTSWTGDGTTVAFSTTVQSFPILPDSLVITDNVEVFEDTNQTWTTSNVTIAGSLGGTASVNYSAGSISVTFTTAPIDGQNIYVSYIQFQPGRPVAVLYYNNQFQFFPPPDTAYRFKLKAYAIVSPLVNASDTPEFPEWGPAIAYGASRDIHADLGEMERYQTVTMLYKEQIAYIMRRTHQNLLNIRTAPTF